MTDPIEERLDQIERALDRARQQGIRQLGFVDARWLIDQLLASRERTAKAVQMLTGVLVRTGRETQ